MSDTKMSKVNFENLQEILVRDCLTYALMGG